MPESIHRSNNLTLDKVKITTSILKRLTVKTLHNISLTTKKAVQ